MYSLIVGVLFLNAVPIQKEKINKPGENEEAQKVWHTNISLMIPRVSPECMELKFEPYGEDILPLGE